MIEVKASIPRRRDDFRDCAAVSTAAGDDGKVSQSHFFRDETWQMRDNVNGRDDRIGAKVSSRDTTAFAECADLGGVDGARYQGPVECNDTWLDGMYVLAQDKVRERDLMGHCFANVYGHSGYQIQYAHEPGSGAM